MDRLARQLLIALVLPYAAYANLNDELNKFFDKFGASSNVSCADVYNGQKAGYFTGGGLTVRNRVLNSKLATVNLPRFDAGCGGIDLYLGGFSFINGDELVQGLKSIGSASTGYAFMLGLESVSPQVANTMKQMQSWANYANNLSINSCETAATLVGSVWPGDSMASQHICRTMGGNMGAFSDHAAARHKCSQRSDYDQLMQRVESKPEYKDLLGDEYNLTYKAIQRQQFLSGNRELAELFMSLVGTVVVRKDKNTHIETFPPQAANQDFLQGLMYGGEPELYRCQDWRGGKCLKLQKEKTAVSADSAWVGRIRTQLSDIQSNILADRELDQEQKELLLKTRLPLYRIVNALTAYKKGHSPIELTQLAEIVAMDLMCQYLREVLEVVREGAWNLRGAQAYSTKIDEYLAGLDRIESAVSEYETRNHRTMEMEFTMMQKIQTIEEQLAAQIWLD